jgi:acetolactate synthase-1/2/3 large subunit
MSANDTSRRTNLNRAVATHPGLQAVYCQHEQACVAAAEGYAKASDFRRAGFACVTAGPGVSNTVTSLLSAFGDSTPLIVLAGQIKTDDIDRYGTRAHGAQEVPSPELIRPCVKRFARLDRQNYRDLLIETLSEAFKGRPGPVFVEIPLDVQGTPLDYSEADVTSAVERIHAAVDADLAAGANAEGITLALRQLLQAKRPVLYVGNGCRIAMVEDAVRGFIAKHNLPAVFSWLSFDILSSRQPWHFGCPGGLAPISSNQVLFGADVIVFLGARLDLGTTAFQREAFGAQAERFYVDIDPTELDKFKDYAHAHCIQANLRALPQAIAALGSAASAADPSWLPSAVERHKEYLADERRRLASEKLTVYGVAERLSAWSDGKLFVPASSGYAEETFSRFFAPGEGTRFFNGASLGSMGLGLPHSIGASFGSSRRVLCLEADGGLMLNIQELATLSNYAPKGFVLFVLNNRGYESIRVSQSKHFGSISGVDRETGLFIPELSKLAQAYELRYTRVDTPAELDALLPQLNAGDSPIMVDLRIERFENRGPSVKTIIDKDGNPHSTPLAELAW